MRWEQQWQARWCCSGVAVGAGSKLVGALLGWKWLKIELFWSLFAVVVVTFADVAEVTAQVAACGRVSTPSCSRSASSSSYRGRGSHIVPPAGKGGTSLRQGPVYLPLYCTISIAARGGEPNFAAIHYVDLKYKRTASVSVTIHGIYARLKEDNKTCNRKKSIIDTESGTAGSAQFGLRFRLKAR
ncbi:hypothetical protein EI94DRAFT_1786933 [Lactarius quietus]|nr:hypothetical protein EI94DRAFT_1786933 [Lactarius quietus]